MITWRKKSWQLLFWRKSSFENLKRMKPLFFMCLVMFIWLPLLGAKCSIPQWCNSSGEENITSWEEQKTASSFGGKCSIRKKLENYCSFWSIQPFFSHVGNISQRIFIERCSRMAETLNDTALSETQWVVWKKIDQCYPGILNRLAGFGTFHPLSLHCKGLDAIVDFSSFWPLVNKTQWFLVDWTTATAFRE